MKSIPYLCPVCRGTGIVGAYKFNSDQSTWPGKPLYKITYKENIKEEDSYSYMFNKTLLT